jgi:uncharacterized YccA/Bax inhibitor family protein
MSMQTTQSTPRLNRAFTRLNNAFPVQVGAEPFTAAGVYDKVGILVVLAMATGLYNYLADSTALLIGGIIGGLVFSLVGLFKPHTAKFMAPLYALAEGLALGGLTAYYAAGNNGIIPLAIIFTAGIFLAALVIFRSGLVKISPKYLNMMYMALGGFFLVTLAVVFGLPIPGLSGASGELVIGVIGLLVGIMFLFVDFNFIYATEQNAAFPAEAEWFGALLLMTSLVMVYINVLRILGRRR